MVLLLLFLARMPIDESKLLKLPLYTQEVLDKQECERIKWRRGGYPKANSANEYIGGQFDTFCVGCSKHSTYRSSSQTERESKSIYRHLDHVGDGMENRATSAEYFAFIYECMRSSLHKIVLIFRLVGEDLVKIGQYPTRADIEKKEVARYSKVLDKAKLSELTRAIGLVSHGVGIGSFVYLRRILEHLVSEAYEKARQKADFDNEEYEKNRIVERIKMLKDELPVFFVDNAAIYSILSKGIHELDEGECLKYFEPLRLSIQMILDERLETIEKANNLKKLSSTIGEIQLKIEEENTEEKEENEDDDNPERGGKEK